MRPLVSLFAAAFAAVLAGLTLAPMQASHAFGTSPAIDGAPRQEAAPGIELPDDVLEPLGALPEEDPHAAPAPAAVESAGPPPEIHPDNADLPPVVAAMRERIIAAARSGDVEALRPVIELSEPPPLFSALGEGDPVDILRAASGDDAGREILAILIDVLESGYAVRNGGTPQARYVWPYFAELAPDSLTPPQLVDLYRVMTAGDFEEMRGVGSYEFYRLEIAADGRWLLFMSGE